MRQTFINELIKINKINNNIVVLTGDVGKSTYANYFFQEFPDRFFNLGICESNIIGISAGIAGTSQFIPVVMLFSKHLVLRALEQINDSILMNKKKVILVGGYAGYSAAKEGETHQLLNDVSILNSFPDISIYSPYDRYSIKEAINESIDNDLASYIKLSSYSLVNGEVIDRIVRHEISNIIISTGVLGALLSKEYSKDEFIKENVDFMLSNKIKPIDWTYWDNLLLGYDNIFIVEENCSIGGFGAQFKNRYQNRKCFIKVFGIGEHFGASADYITLLENEGIAPSQIIKDIKRVLNESFD